MLGTQGTQGTQAAQVGMAASIVAVVLLKEIPWVSVRSKCSFLALASGSIGRSR
jgi:hypothetical protein